jgi:hypothetical protein
MRITQRKVLLLTACLFLVSSLASAEVITFNSLPGNGTAIPNGFAEFGWNNLYDMSYDMTVARLVVENAASAGSVNSTLAVDNGGAPAWFASTRTFSFANALVSTDGIDSIRLEVVGPAEP